MHLEVLACDGLRLVCTFLLFSAEPRCDVSVLLYLPPYRLRLFQSSQWIQIHVCVLMFYIWEVLIWILSLFLS